MELKQPPSRELKTMEIQAVEGLRGESIFLSDLPPPTEETHSNMGSARMLPELPVKKTGTNMIVGASAITQTSD